MNYLRFPVVVCLMVSACAAAGPVEPISEVEPGAAIEGLRRALALTAERRGHSESDLHAAFEAWDAERTETSAIWVGRRLAYLGFYEAAIDWYAQASSAFPESYRLWRHRGHREITLREPALAIACLERARVLAADSRSELEPDGAPNPLGIPVSTTHGNIDYHLALAHYLVRDFESASQAWRRCFETWAQNDDARVASGHWLYTTLMRLDRPAEARAVIDALPAGLEVIENFAYRDLIELYAGRATAEDLLAGLLDPNQNAGLIYGIARWLVVRGDPASRARGEALMEDLASHGAWASFGRIAAEFDIADG